MSAPGGPGIRYYIELQLSEESPGSFVYTLTITNSANSDHWTSWPVPLEAGKWDAASLEARRRAVGLIEVLAPGGVDEIREKGFFSV